MNKITRTLLLWSPRILGIAVALFLGMFALDAFSEGEAFLEALPHFFLHTIPALVVLAIVAVSWRWEWVGAAACVALAVLYAVSVQRWDWIVTISGPLFVVGSLFLWSWRHHHELHLRT